MSNRPAYPLSRSAKILTLVACSTLFFDATTCRAQGFSIFESPTEDTERVVSPEEPVVSSEEPNVSPKEAFTNPIAVLPKSQFGSFDKTASEATPKLQGSKATGTYAHQGPDMFKQSPGEVPVDEGKLKPFVANSLRPQKRPEPDPPKVKEAKPPVVASDFSDQARRLPRPNTIQPKVGTQEPADDTPQVAQVAFQEGGFNPSAQKPAGTGATRFSLGTRGGDRFDAGASQTRSQGSPQGTSGFGRPLGPIGSQSEASQSAMPTTQPSRPTVGPTRRQPLTPSRNPLNPSGNTSVQPAPRQNFPAARNPLPRTQQNLPGPARTPRVAMKNQPLTRVASKTRLVDEKPQPKSAKELLNQWLLMEAETKSPGKKMKLHELLARPISGSKKDAINQYWETYADMARNRLAVEHAQWLDSIQSPRQQAEQAILKAAQQRAQMRVMQTDLQLVKSQFLLGEYMPNLRYKNGQIIPVLPNSTPWVGKINTRLKEYQKRGMVPTQFSGIDSYLVKARKLIASESEAVVASGQAAEQAKVALRTGQTSLANVLEALRIQERNEDELLSAVVGYNRAITDYVLSVRQDIYQPKRLASVLIGRKSVEPTLAKTRKPEKSGDSSKELSDEPTLRQVSAPVKKKKQKKLPGISAYQDEKVTEEQPDETDSILNDSVETTDNTDPKAEFEYGPTAESATASNFDAAKLKEELPMKQVKPASSTSYQGGGQQAARTAPGRNASRANAFNQRSAGSGIVGRGGVNSQNGGLNNRQPVQPAGGATAGGGFANPLSNPAAQPSGMGGGLAPQRPAVTGAADSAPKIPATTNPFTESTAVKPTTGASIGNRVGGGTFGGGGGGTFGGGTFNPNQSKPASTASGVGTPGFPTRR